MTTAVLLLAYGGPDRLEDIPAYLLDIRGGRKTPQHLVDEISERYRLIGGKSPLLDITRSVAAKLAGETGLPVYVGMRHWQPWIKDTVAEMAADGVTHMIAICMAPHYSSMSVGAYRARLEEALSAVAAGMRVDFVQDWYTQASYQEAIVANVQETLRRWPEEDRERVGVVFTAHSLPEAILQRGDPYDQQLKETAQTLAAKLNLSASRWMFSYQSAAQTGTPSLGTERRSSGRKQWLGPQIEEVIPRLAARGKTDLLIAPVGFIADHVEILYDIDIGVQQIARKHGVRVERTPMLNDSPGLIAALADIVDKALARSS